MRSEQQLRRRAAPCCRAPTHTALLPRHAAGTHLIAHSCFRTLERGGQFVLLGSAPDPKVQAEFNALSAQVR